MKICAVEGCSDRVLAKGFCQVHYWRNHRHGSPFTNPSRDGAPLDWIAIHIGHNDDECLTWPFGYGSSGYGSVFYKTHIMGAHRAMCFEAHGKPPSEAHQAAHSCGNGHLGCVNPKHLRWATAQENAADKLAHQRGNKLSIEQCREIATRALNEKGRDLAAEFGVSAALVSKLKRGYYQRSGIANELKSA